jgi:hypothetical protein
MLFTKGKAQAKSLSGRTGGIDRERRLEALAMHVRRNASSVADQNPNVILIDTFSAHVHNPSMAGWFSGNFLSLRIDSQNILLFWTYDCSLT